MTKKIIFLLFFSCLYGPKMHSQNGFNFYYGIEKQQLKFQLINNLIILPMEVNGKKLRFILDSGVNKTILFNLSKNDSIGLKNIEKISLMGLGKGNPMDALISKNNQIKIKNLRSNNETIYVLLRDDFNLSGKMGVTINGIIGYNLLRNTIANINYRSKKITFYKPKMFTYPRCRKCEVFPLQFYRKKPYIDIEVQLDTIGTQKTPVKMLIDSGGSDAIWLFENSKKVIKTPKKMFRDVLGEGLSGTIYGNRSRIPKIKIGKFELKKPTVSFLDSLSSFNARKFKERNGSIGGNILKRFKVWIDYPNKKITLKKNGSFRNGFNYNMSGISVVYNGQQLVKEATKVAVQDSFDRDVDQRNTLSFVTNYSYKFKPSYKISHILTDSPADKAGLLKDDILLRINGKPVHQLEMKDILFRFQEQDSKKVKLLIERFGDKMYFEFRLKKKI